MNISYVISIAGLCFFAGMTLTYYIIAWYSKEPEKHLDIALTHVVGLRRGLRNAKQSGDIHPIMLPAMDTMDRNLESVETHLRLAKEG